jgi:hypothetical protein
MEACEEQSFMHAGTSASRSCRAEKIRIPDADGTLLAPPGRAYIEAALPDVLEGRIEPCKVFYRTAARPGASSDALSHSS